MENKRKTENFKKRERVDRILDATAELILRWGYNKTTIDDIARQAGVAKGTIYLHWKTREDLFKALLKRERLEHARDFQERILNDPLGCTLRGITRHSVLAVMKRPLLKAILLGDMEVLGKLAPGERNSSAYAERLAGFKSYLQLLNQYGLLRSDLNLQKQVHIWSAVFSGFLLGAPLMPDEFSLPDEELAELMAETIQSALMNNHEINPETLSVINQTFRQYVEQGLLVLEQQFSQETD
ncbi:MAG: TetR/AcrR family transcriptional regulator [Anaerolineae bacterium]|nr:TetR/AcrR family transcriptional regulator [Anaerolineae bacterium]